MKSKMKRPLQGLVVDLPENEGIGVILGAHRLNNNTYVGNMMGENGRTYWAKFVFNSRETNTPITYVKHFSYDAMAVADFLKCKEILENK